MIEFLDWVFHFWGFFETFILTGETLFCLKLSRFRKNGLPVYLVLSGIYTYFARFCPWFAELPVFHFMGFNTRFTVMFLFSMLIIYASFEINWKQTLFFGITMHIMQHLWYCMLMALDLYTGWDYENFITDLLRFFSADAMMLFIWFVLADQVRKKEDITINNLYLILFSIIAYLLVNVLHMLAANAPSVPAGTRAGFMNYISFIYASVVCVLLLTNLFGVFSRTSLMHEKEMMEKIFAESEVKHRMTQDNIDIINRKCHDLKYQIASMRSIQSSKERDQCLSELEQNVMFYDIAAKTGNETLDVLLMDKSLACEKHHIRFTYMLDGQAFSFMEHSDLYCLFGNALDNAIESVCKIEDAAKRVITMRGIQENRLLLLELDNAFEGALVMEDGLPQTTKDDKENHGFGMKSIRFIARKYGGNIVTEQADGHFILRILFPVKAS